jgi:hypothetical protein
MYIVLSLKKQHDFVNMMLELLAMDSDLLYSQISVWIFNPFPPVVLEKLTYTQERF